MATYKRILAMFDALPSPKICTALADNQFDMFTDAVFTRLCDGDADVDERTAFLAKIVPEKEFVKIIVISERDFAAWHLIAGAASREATGEPVRVSLQWNAYNFRRYGKPWIARITAWAVGATPDLEFGGYVGSADEGGELEITARPGDLLRYGQKDTRNPRGTINEWAVVEAGGTARLITAAEARAIFAQQEMAS
ncbi:MAG: hypothetical protein LBB65_05255 [Burkholderiales bacterium]|jgi:CRISPR/Cas system-associated protein endoribonuclease Cas2|nr:hypothetical protein [Burkholderiales bacterium]